MSTFPIMPDDILWTRTGDPIRVSTKDPQTGKLGIDTDFQKVRQTTEAGLQNGLPTAGKEAFRTVLSSVENNDKKQEIRDLFKQISSLKEKNADAGVIKYLENELKHKMSKERYLPADYRIDSIVLGS